MNRLRCYTMLGCPSEGASHKPHHLIEGLARLGIRGSHFETVAGKQGKIQLLTHDGARYGAALPTAVDSNTAVDVCRTTSQQTILAAHTAEHARLEANLLDRAAAKNKDPSFALRSIT
jgi:hypothetical protein